MAQNRFLGNFQKNVELNKASPLFNRLNKSNTALRNGSNQQHIHLKLVYGLEPVLQNHSTLD